QAEDGIRCPLVTGVQTCALPIFEFAFKFFPKGYTPLYRRSSMSLGNSIDIDTKPNQANQELHAYSVLQEHTKIITFEPHMHATGVRMCLEAIWGVHSRALI